MLLDLEHRYAKNIEGERKNNAKLEEKFRLELQEFQQEKKKEIESLKKQISNLQIQLSEGNFALRESENKKENFNKEAERNLNQI